MSSRIVPVIMCGGAGTRLWPISRESMPKQFVPLIGGVSTFQQVLERVADSDVFSCPVVITSSEFRFVVAEQAQACGIPIEILWNQCPVIQVPLWRLRQNLSAGGIPWPSCWY